MYTLQGADFVEVLTELRIPYIRISVAYKALQILKKDKQKIQKLNIF